MPVGSEKDWLVWVDPGPSALVAAGHFQSVAWGSGSAEKVQRFPKLDKVARKSNIKPLRLL